MYKHLTRGALALALLTAACSSDGPTGSSTAELTEEEVYELAGALTQIGFTELAQEAGKLSQGSSSQSMSAGGFQPLADPPVSSKHEFTATANCRLGGTVGLQATLDVTRYPDEERVVVDLTGSQAHDKCRVPLRRGGTIEVTGAPKVSWEVHFEAVQGELVGALTVEYKGGFTWAKSNGRSGQCTVDLSGEVNPEEGKATLKGTLCNLSITKEVTWEVAA
ncbi:MAG TPA: hypothetical protein VIL13_00590 [Longimicrobiales bacterium]